MSLLLFVGLCLASASGKRRLLESVVSRQVLTLRFTLALRTVQPSRAPGSLLATFTAVTPHASLVMMWWIAKK